MVFVVSQGWHTDIGVEANRLQGPMAVFRSVFPGARYVMFGYGKRTFMTAPADELAEYLLGPFPGPAVIETLGLAGDPGQAYGPAHTIRLALSGGADAALSAFLWRALAHGRDGGPKLVAPGWFKGGLFYAATARYSLDHTCNSWVAEALQAAGLPMRSDLVFSGQLMARAARIAARQCPAGQLQGGADPSEQTTRDPGGTTTVPPLAGALSPPKLELQAASTAITARRTPTRTTLCGFCKLMPE